MRAVLAITDQLCVIAVLADMIVLFTAGLYSHGLKDHGHGLCSYGLYSYGPCSCANPIASSSAAPDLFPLTIGQNCCDAASDAAGHVNPHYCTHAHTHAYTHDSKHQV